MMKKPIIFSMIALITASLIYLLKPVLLPFLVGSFLAYLGDPLVIKLQRLKISRTLAAVIVFAFILIVIGLLITGLIPLLQNQASMLVEKIPAIINALQNVVIPWVNHQANALHIPTSINSSSVQELVSNHWQQTGRVVSSMWQAISKSSGAIFEWLINLLLIPVVTFYLLRDWPVLLSNLEGLLPRNNAKQTIQLIKECDGVLSAFFRGQLMVMLALAAVYSLGLSMIGLQVAVLIGLIAGLLSIVPYLGFFIGLISALLAALVQFHDGMHLVYVLIVFLIGNAMESMALTPWLIGDKIGLHPVAVIFAILAGGHLFGFMGVLLALPVAAILMVFLRHIQTRYKSSALYQ
jgi:predicted PurR-regulated permease PerM